MLYVFVVFYSLRQSTIKADIPKAYFETVYILYSKGKKEATIVRDKRDSVIVSFATE